MSYRSCVTCIRFHEPVVSDECFECLQAVGYPLWQNADDPVKEIVEKTHEAKATETQEGGDHYKGYAIQPIEFIKKNDVPFIEGNIIKYTMRHRQKNGAEDIKKVIHYAQLLLELEYDESSSH